MLFHIGRYFIMLSKIFSKPEKHSIYWRKTMREVMVLGIDSLPIIAIISIFMGAVVTIQTATNIEGSMIPMYLVGYTARQSVVLEFSCTMMSLILAGKIGSSIASELGLMRVTEQIDALEIMGINSKSYLIGPKIVALVFINPFLMFISMFLGIGGAWFAGVINSMISTSEFVYGIQYDFDPFSITYATTKMIFFAFLIASIPAYHGYFVEGGAQEVGRASTRAVVFTMIAILVINYAITQVMLI
ncbi:MAG: ABC transporter permease [Flavobacteriales bacterium]|nr:MAG: ABC transporter permease [Flavobacteriales bacterium]